MRQIHNLIVARTIKFELSVISSPYSLGLQQKLLRRWISKHVKAVVANQCSFNSLLPKLLHYNINIPAGAFMGFDDSEMDGSDSEPDVEGQKAQPRVPILNEPDNLPIFEDQLLDGLQNWLDRLFEGSTYRYHINYWPEFPISPANFNARSH